jgi:hypothetical protein
VALAAAALLTGCGHTHPLSASTEGVYLQFGQLRYQVGISRELNPRDHEDASYLLGLTRAQAHLRPDQSFYGVWILVENRSTQTQVPTMDFRITDTQHNVYRPIVPNATNVFAYRSSALPGKGQIPDPEGAASNSPTQGALVLFKLTQASYDNRPLVFEITDPATGKTGTTDLDV